MARSTEDGRDLSRRREEGQANLHTGGLDKNDLDPEEHGVKQRRADLLAQHLAGVWEEEMDADCRKLRQFTADFPITLL